MKTSLAEDAMAAMNALEDAMRYQMAWFSEATAEHSATIAAIEARYPEVLGQATSHLPVRVKIDRLFAHAQEMCACVRARQALDDDAAPDAEEEAVHRQSLEASKLNTCRRCHGSCVDACQRCHGRGVDPFPLQEGVIAR